RRARTDARRRSMALGLSHLWARRAADHGPSATLRRQGNAAGEDKKCRRRQHLRVPGFANTWASRFSAAVTAAAAPVISSPRESEHIGHLRPVHESDMECQAAA